MRQDFINQTTLRNDIELFSFSDKGPHFGTRHAHILDAYLQNREGETFRGLLVAKTFGLLFMCNA
ncbi:hypothetical protein Rin_00002770 [Candidatus Regiella insecticola 5.15]|uniref:Uncharacterized protein n=1 Tax=Candidatus Regiella insecticola 5.15 TaxID=1005043 RepID=G2GWZ0_9ENTR|nr:hypothetical protein [Candidatus Regiella insecticola]EGY29740.1 hypothetical protein Rin_00002770 [Candidatus Regiella insecticola 5.15]